MTSHTITYITRYTQSMRTLRRLFYRVIKPIRKVYWFVCRPETVGVKCLIEHDGKFLCILNSYYPKWTFPGGGVGRKETLLQAARRESLEEVGVDIEDWRLLGEYHSEREYKRDVVYCFHAVAPNSEFMIDNDEVVEAGWFSTDEIPNPRSFAVKEVLSLF